MVKPGYKRTEVGVVPEDWESESIGDSIDLLTGFPFPSLGYSTEGVRLLRGSNVKRDKIDWAEHLTQYWPKMTSDIAHYALDVGDIVVAMDGSLVGRSFAMLSEEDVPALLLQRVARIRSKVLAQAYLKTWICSPHFTRYSDSVKTVTAIPHISPQDIREFRIAIPPTRVEQEAIAGALSDGDALIESLEGLIAKKRQIKQGAMQELLTGKARLPGFQSNTRFVESDVGAIPKDWRLGRLRAHITQSATYGVVKAGDFVNAGIRMVRGGDIKNGQIAEDLPLISPSKSSEYSRTVLQHGDVVIALVGYPGESAVVAKTLAGANISRAVGLLRPGSTLSSKYLVSYLNSSIGRTEFLRPGAGSAQLVVNLRDLNLLWVPLPPTKAEQEAIASVLSDMDAEIAALETKLAKSRQIKQGMMQELLTGRIRLV